MVIFVVFVFPSPVVRNFPSLTAPRHSDAGDSLTDRGALVADEDLLAEGAGHRLPGLRPVQPGPGAGLRTLEGEIPRDP